MSRITREPGRNRISRQVDKNWPLVLRMVKPNSNSISAATQQTLNHRSGPTAFDKFLQYLETEEESDDSAPPTPVQEPPTLTSETTGCSDDDTRSVSIIKNDDSKSVSIISNDDTRSVSVISDEIESSSIRGVGEQSEKQEDLRDYLKDVENEWEVMARIANTAPTLDDILGACPDVRRKNRVRSAPLSRKYQSLHIDWEAVDNSKHHESISESETVISEKLDNSSSCRSGTERNLKSVVKRLEKIHIQRMDDREQLRRDTESVKSKTPVNRNSPTATSEADQFEDSHEPGQLERSESEIDQSERSESEIDQSELIQDGDDAQKPTVSFVLEELDSEDGGLGLSEDDRDEEGDKYQLQKRKPRKRRRQPTRNKMKRLHHSLVDTPYILVPARNIYSQKVRERLRTKYDICERSRERSVERLAAGQNQDKKLEKSMFCPMCNHQTTDLDHALRAQLKLSHLNGIQEHQKIHGANIEPRYYKVQVPKRGNITNNNVLNSFRRKTRQFMSRRKKVKPQVEQRQAVVNETDSDGETTRSDNNSSHQVPEQTHSQVCSSCCSAMAWSRNSTDIFDETSPHTKPRELIKKTAEDERSANQTPDESETGTKRDTTITERNETIQSIRESCDHGSASEAEHVTVRHVGTQCPSASQTTNKVEVKYGQNLKKIHSKVMKTPYVRVSEIARHIPSTMKRVYNTEQRGHTHRTSHR